MPTSDPHQHSQTNPPGGDSAEPFVITRAVPGTNAEISLVLLPNHEIRVRRGPAWSGFNVSPAKEFVWTGPVPDPDAPCAPTQNRAKGADKMTDDPVGSMMEAARKTHRLTVEERVDAGRIWDDLWAELAPHLHQRAARLARTYGYGAPLYAELRGRSDLCDHLELCPAVGPFLTREKVRLIPETGMSLKEIVSLAISSPEEKREVTPGFMAWSQGLRWTSENLPFFSKDPKERLAEMRSFVLRAQRLGPAIDPNGVHKLQTADEWLLANMTLSSERSVDLLPKILANPQAALNQVTKYFPPGMKYLRLSDGSDLRLDRRGRIQRVIDAVIEWRQAETEEAARADTFKGMIERARKWDQKMWHAESQQMAAYEAVLLAIRKYQEELAQHVLDELAAAGVDPAKHALAWPIGSEFGHLLPPDERTVEIGDLKMVMLSRPADLLLEGKIQKHCVGGNSYVEKCAEGEIYILSLRNAEEEDDYIVRMRKHLEKVQQGTADIRSAPKRPVALATIEVDAHTFSERQMQKPKNHGATPQSRANFDASVEHAARFARAEFRRRCDERRTEIDANLRAKTRLVAEMRQEAGDNPDPPAARGRAPARR